MFFKTLFRLVDKVENAPNWVAVPTFFSGLSLMAYAAMQENKNPSTGPYKERWEYAHGAGGLFKVRYPVAPEKEDSSPTLKK